MCCWSQGAAVILRLLPLPHPCQQMAKSVSSPPDLQAATQVSSPWKPLLSMPWRLALMPAWLSLMQVVVIPMELASSSCVTPNSPLPPPPCSPPPPMSPTLPPQPPHLQFQTPPLLPPPPFPTLLLAECLRPQACMAHLHLNLTCLMAFNACKSARVLPSCSLQVHRLCICSLDQQTCACRIHTCMYAYMPELLKGVG